MGRAPVSFKERDLIRAVKAINKAGLRIKVIEIDRSGRIVVMPVDGVKQQEQPDRNEWDKALGHEAR